MDKDELKQVLDHAFGAWNIDPHSDTGQLRAAAWSHHFGHEPVGVMRAALERAIVDSALRFPTVGQMRAYVAQARLEARRDTRAARQPEPPMTPAERREWALVLSQAAFDRGTRLGRRDHWVQYLEALATVYAENAARTVAGQPRVPLPKLASLMGGIGKAVG